MLWPAPAMQYLISRARRPSPAGTSQSHESLAKKFIHPFSFKFHVLHDRLLSLIAEIFMLGQEMVLVFVFSRHRVRAAVHEASYSKALVDRVDVPLQIVEL